MDLRALIFAAFFTALPGAALAEGDAAAGAKVFNRCKACHEVDKPRNKVGPHLVGIIGRPAASVPDFAKYSDAAAGLIWDEVSLSEYFSDPKGRIPGNTMAFSGLKKPEDIANLLAFLKSAPTQ